MINHFPYRNSICFKKLPIFDEDPSRESEVADLGSIKVVLPYLLQVTGFPQDMSDEKFLMGNQMFG